MITQEIKNLRKRGLSYNEISRELGIGIKIVRNNCLGVRMSESGIKRYSTLNGLIKKIKFNEELNETKVRIMSNLLFDGAVYISKAYHYSMMYVNSSDELVNQFIEDMKEIYNVGHSGFEIFPTYKRVKYNSKIIYQDLKKYFQSYSTSSEECIIPDEIVNGPESYKIIILRAFWENEGSVSYTGVLSADLKSFKVIQQLSRLHNEFGLKHNITRYKNNGWAYKLFLAKNKENYQRFLNLELFSKAKVTKGYFKGKKKIDVIKDYFYKKFIQSPPPLSYPYH